MNNEYYIVEYCFDYEEPREARFYDKPEARRFLKQVRREGDPKARLVVHKYKGEAGSTAPYLSDYEF